MTFESLRNLEKNIMCHFTVSMTFADDVTPLGANPEAGTEISKFRSYITWQVKGFTCENHIINAKLPKEYF